MKDRIPMYAADQFVGRSGTTTTSRSNGAAPISNCQAVSEIRSTWCLLAKALDEDAADGPADGARQAQEFAELAGMHVPGLDDERQSSQGTDRGQPLRAADAFTQKRPGHQQHPEWHGVVQDRRLSGAAFNQGPCLEYQECSDIDKCDRKGLRRDNQAQRSTEESESQEQRQSAAEATLRGKCERGGVNQCLLGQNPGKSPDQRQYDQRNRRAPGAVLCRKWGQTRPSEEVTKLGGTSRLIPTSAGKTGATTSPRRGSGG